MHGELPYVLIMQGVSLEYFVEPIVIDPNDCDEIRMGDDLYISRQNVSDSRYDVDSPMASIVVTCYNRLEKTKKCIESILKYTHDVDYELILVDNGSVDELTYKYLQEVPVKKKTVLKVTKNRGSFYSIFKIMKFYKGRYLVSVSNDLIMTSNWLSNLIKCYESDASIGLVVPMSTNVSNLQEINRTFKNINQLQSFALRNNVYNPLKWKERLRLITPLTVLRREIIELVGLVDYGFFHDFVEDDLCIRIRRAGYKLFLCEDTFIHHDHDFRNMEGKDPEEYRESLVMGRQNYRQKYFGLDAWDDVNNYELNLINMLNVSDHNKDIPCILGVDVRMGTPILEVKNKLREKGIFNCKCEAFTTQAKYFLDLQTICGKEVYCDRIDYIFEYFISNKFDYIVLGEPINTYQYPIKLLQRLIEFGKTGAKILIKLKNTKGFHSFVDILGGLKADNCDMVIDINVGEIVECAKIMGITNYQMKQEMIHIENETFKTINSIVKDAKLTSDVHAATNQIITDYYLLSLTK